MSIKKALLENFFKFHAKAPLNCSSSIDEIQSNDQLIRSQSTNNFLLKTVQESPRTSSVQSRKLLNSSQNIVSSFIVSPPLKKALSELTVKKVLGLSLARTEDNTLWLLHSLLVLASLADAEIKSCHLLISRVSQTFRQYTKNPAKLIQTLKKVPSKLSSISQNLSKQLQASFKLIVPSKLKAFQEFYNFVSECLVVVNRDKGSTTPDAGSYFSSLSPSRGSLTKSINRISNNRKSPAKTPSKLAYSKNQFNSTETPSKLAYSKIQFNSTETSIFLKSFNRKKTERFMMDSRINKRIQEKLTKFLREREMCLDRSEGEVRESLMKEFIASLSSSEISESSLKFLEYFKKSKEYEKNVKRLTNS